MDPEILEAFRRNSGIRLTKEGVFHYSGGVVENPRVQALFHRGIEVRADGEVILRVGPQWCYVACEGVARFVEALPARSGEGRGARGHVIARLLGGREVDGAGARFGYGPDDRVYGWFAELRGPALLLRVAHQSLLLCVDAEGALEIAGHPFELRRLSSAPRPADPWPGEASRR